MCRATLLQSQTQRAQQQDQQEGNTPLRDVRCWESSYQQLHVKGTPGTRSCVKGQTCVVRHIMKEGIESLESSDFNPMSSRGCHNQVSETKAGWREREVLSGQLCREEEEAREAKMHLLGANV